MNLYDKHTNPFEFNSGAMRLVNETLILSIIAVLTILLLFITNTQILGITICVSAFFIFVVTCIIFKNPKAGIYLLIAFGFFVTGATRYVNFPWGLVIDAVLVLIYIGLFFKGFGNKVSWNKANSTLTVLVAIWMLYVLFQLANPEVLTREAWLYAMRGVGMYQLLIIPLLFVLFDKQKDLNVFFILWGILSILGSLKGIYQFQFGVDSFEQIWLHQGGAETHILFGKLRIFSFYSDAGQFGASQAHAGVVFGILALFKKTHWKLKSLFLCAAFLGFIGMFISGTRGAIAVPAMGGLTFLILRKNSKILLLGVVFGLGVYVFFAHTTIGQGNAEIRRMRTAFNLNDASLQVRLSNQQKLKGYLASRPFGGGLGATGNWGMRFTPHSFLANTATDSWYVMIWADTGIVGLIYYLFMILFILFTGAYNVMFKLKDKNLRIQITALTCGMAGILLASYGNGVLGQMPTGILMYVTMFFMFLSPKIDPVKEIKMNALNT